jgi:iron(III) transport system substrate-binding protein
MLATLAPRGRRLVTALALLLVLGTSLLASSAGAARMSGSGTEAQEATPKGYTPAQWRALVARAKAEGTVVFYSGQSTLNLNRLVEGFQKKYGIRIVYSRLIDNASRAAVNAEISTGRPIADVWELSSKAITTGALKNGWAVDARGPELFKKQFNRKRFTYGKATIIGSGVLGMAWNTGYVPGGVRDLTDYLSPQFANRRLALPDPAPSPSIVDWYHWLEEKYGANILQRLAAQKPRLYLGVQPIQQAIMSGEVAAAPYATAAVLSDRENGAPINFKLPLKGAWNVPFYTLILKQAPHPNAAQLLLNYMISREGQQVMSYRTGAIYKGIPETFYVVPRNQKLSDFTPAKIAAFQAKFNALFRG